MRRTKIIATLGPATSDAKVLDRIIEAGVDVVRINFSHGNPEEHIERAEKLRNRARAHGRQIGVLCDLQGPKIRIEKFKDTKIILNDGDLFVLDTAMDPNAGTTERVGMAYKELPQDVKRGDTLCLMMVVLAYGLMKLSALKCVAKLRLAENSLIVKV